MEAGPLNKRITIQYPIRVPDGMGGFSESFADVADPVWAAIWPVRANELVTSDSTTMNITHRIRIRYRSVFKSNWRIKFGNRYFAIVSILNPKERNEILELLCKEAI
jgi:SPP1 family predicted phage head-tail adaptor